MTNPQSGGKTPQSFWDRALTPHSEGASWLSKSQGTKSGGSFWDRALTPHSQAANWLGTAKNPPVSPGNTAWVTKEPGETRSLALGNWFKVDLDGDLQTLGFWNQASGLAVSWNMLEYRVGDQGNDRWFFPGVTTYQNIVLKRAACQDSMLVKKWLDKASFKYRKPVNGVITLYSAEASPNQAVISGSMNSSIRSLLRKPPIMTWELKRMMPLKWNIDGFDAGSNKVVIETLEFTHEGFLDDDHKPRG